MVDARQDWKDRYPRPIVLFEAVPSWDFEALDIQSPTSQRLSGAFNNWFATHPFKDGEFQKLFECRNLFDGVLKNPNIDPCDESTMARVRSVAPELKGRIVVMANRVALAFKAAYRQPWDALRFCALSDAAWISSGCRAGWIYHSAVCMAPFFDQDRDIIAKFLYDDVLAPWRSRRSDEYRRRFG